MYDPTTASLDDLGPFWPTDDTYWISSLAVADDGRVYGTTDGAGGDATGGGRFFVYDPVTNLVTDLGDVTGNGSRHGVRVAVGLDGKVYIGTPYQGSTSPHLLVYDPGTGTISDLGGVVSEGSAAWVYALTAATDGNLYGGTGNVAHLFLVNVTGTPTPTPPTPILLSPGTGTSFGGTSITFQWSAPSGASTYWLEVNTDQNWGTGPDSITHRFLPHPRLSLDSPIKAQPTTGVSGLAMPMAGVPQHQGGA